MSVVPQVLGGFSFKGSVLFCHSCVSPVEKGVSKFPGGNMALFLPSYPNQAALTWKQGKLYISVGEVDKEDCEYDITTELKCNNEILSM